MGWAALPLAPHSADLKVNFSEFPAPASWSLSVHGSGHVQPLAGRSAPGGPPLPAVPLAPAREEDCLRLARGGRRRDPVRRQWDDPGSRIPGSRTMCRRRWPCGSVPRSSLADLEAPAAVSEANRAARGALGPGPVCGSTKLVLNALLLFVPLVQGGRRPAPHCSATLQGGAHLVAPPGRDRLSSSAVVSSAAPLTASPR